MNKKQIVEASVEREKSLSDMESETLLASSKHWT